MIPRSKPSRVGATVAVVLLAVSMAACSDSDGAGGGAGAARTSASTTTGAKPPDAAGPGEAFDGSVDEFYEVPDDLPPGKPGDLIRTMPIDAPAGETGLRVMYRSTDAEGDERVVTGQVYYPDGEPPAGGWPILVWTHGTSGMAAACAPSRSPSAPPGYGVKGVRVATDYIGLGPVGEVHPYLSAAAEANSVIDGVVAARSLADAHAGDEWVVVGVSQGGHAALVTGERAAERLPDVELLGTVALAPGAELGGTYGDDLQAKIITTMVLIGAAAEDPDIDLADYLSPEALKASKVITAGCMQGIIDTMPGAAASPDYFTTDPRTAPVGKAWLAENDPGKVASASPLLLVQGGKDILVVPARTAAFFERVCGLGQVVEKLDVPTADHDTVTEQSMDEVGRWIQARFAGDEPGDDCPK